MNSKFWTIVKEVFRKMLNQLPFSYGLSPASYWISYLCDCKSSR